MYCAFQVACNWAMSCRSSHVIKLKLSSQLIGQFGHVPASTSCKGECKSWTLDSGLDHGLDYGLEFGLDFGPTRMLSKDKEERGVYSSFQVGCPKIATRIRACALFWWDFELQILRMRGFSSRFLDNQPENCCSLQWKLPALLLMLEVVSC